MALARKFDRLTITLVPTSDERSFRNVPTTFNTSNRSYSWRQLADLNYMLVPRKISSQEIKVDIFLQSGKRGKIQPSGLQKLVQNFVKEKLESEWRGLRFAGIERVAAAAPPEKTPNRGTIEEMLGAVLDH